MSQADPQGVRMREVAILEKFDCQGDEKVLLETITIVDGTITKREPHASVEKET